MKLVDSIDQTKQWRRKQSWYIDGRRTECEMYQRAQIQTITTCALAKTYNRLHLSKFIIEEIRCPFNRVDGFEWSETFDFIQKIDNLTLYYNLKFIVGKGGGQTSRIKDVYQFINAQLKYPDEKVIFINILDGDGCAAYKKQLNNLQRNPNIYVGDMFHFPSWFSSHIKMIG